MKWKRGICRKIAIAENSSTGETLFLFSYFDGANVQFELQIHTTFLATCPNLHLTLLPLNTSKSTGKLPKFRNHSLVKLKFICKAQDQLFFIVFELPVGACYNFCNDAIA